MDVLKFLESGNVSKNPEYNPKTKKGAIKPPTIVDYNPGSTTSDLGRGNIANTAARNIYNLNQYDVDKYAPYNVYVNPVDPMEDLNKERAKNQSVLEQTGNFVVQVAGSEIALGVARGFSDIIDAGGRLIGVADNDYTNPVSSQLEEWQNAIRDKFEIYKQDPTNNFAFGDSGWWFSNAVSIASTLSLLIPGTVVSKLGKVLGMGRLARGIGKIAGTPFGRPNTWGKAAEAGSEILSTAAASRVAENYIESRDTYNQVFNETKNKLSTISKEEREELYKRNPKLATMDDESIAKYVAGESADDTFSNDMALMLIDAWQLKGIKNIWKGVRNATTTSGLRAANEQAAARLVGREIAQPKGIKKYFSLPDKQTITGIARQSSEGFEEGYQYIQQQIGVDKGRAIFNDQYQSRTFNDYIKDPQMWEQAFWGWMGGIAFEHISSAATRQWAKYVSKNKDIIKEGREAEINSRGALIDKYINNMAILNKNYNPNNPILGDDGTIVKNSDGTDAYEEISDAERDALKQVETEKLVTDLTINAIDKGNYDLLKDFLNTEDVAQYMDKSGAIEQGTSKDFMANINAKMAEVAEMYEGEVNKAINNDAKDATIASTIAKENTYNKLASRAEQKIIDKYNTEYNKLLGNINDTDKANVAALERSIRFEGVKAELDFLEKQRQKAEDDLKNKNITKFEHANKINSINAKIESLIAITGATNVTEFNASLNENKIDDSLSKLNDIDNNILAAVFGKTLAERRKVLVDAEVNDTNKKIKERAKYIENLFKSIEDKEFNEALTTLDTIFENNDVDKVMDYLFDKNTPTDLNDTVKQELDDVYKNLSLFDKSSTPFTDIISRRARLKQKQKGNKPIATINGEAVTTPPVDPNENANPKENDKEEPIAAVPPEAPADPTEPLPTGELEEEKAVVTDTIEDPVDKDVESFLEKQNKIQERQFNASSEINSYLLDNFLSNPNSELVALSYDDQYAYIKNALIGNGLSSEIIDASLPNELNSIRYIYNTINDANEEHESSIDIVIAKILTAEETNKLFYYKQLIDLYKVDNNILSINGNDYFNIISLMRFAIKQSNATFETVNKLYSELSKFLLTNKDTGLININPNTISVSKEKLMELVQDQEKDDKELDNNMGIGKIDENGRAALASMTVGQRIFPLVKPQGVEFYTIVNTAAGPIDVKIGFNIKAKRTKDNDGYIFDDGYIEYELYYDKDGYTSSLDDIFDELNPQNGVIGDDAKTFIDILYKHQSNKLTQEDINSFWNNPIAKNALKLVKNKNTNNENAKRLIDTISKIYLYKVSDNLDNNYQSYIEWIAKQYNNYKMVDTISENKDNIKVTIKYISKGEAIFNDSVVPSNIDDSIVGFNYDNIHLGIIAADGEIHDVSNGSVRIKAGFKNHNMVVIVPNGTNEPFYAKVIPQAFDTTNNIAKAFREEILSAFEGRQSQTIDYETLKDKLLSIFGVKNFIDGVNCIEYDNRIIITTQGSKIPIITVYKFKNNSSETGTGITFNPTQVSGKGNTYTGWNDKIKGELTASIDTILKSAVYSMSHGIAQNKSTNRYVKYLEDGKIVITIGDKVFQYNNYLNYIIDNNAGKIKLGKTTIGGVPSNFNPNSYNNNAKQKVRLEYEVLSPVEESTTGNAKQIDELIAKGDQEKVNTKDLLEIVAPDFTADINDEMMNKLFPKSVDINVSEPHTNYASYNTATNRTTLYSPFFDLIKGDQYKAVRTLVHEQLHSNIFAGGIMKSNTFITRIQTIRNAFIEAINNPASSPLFSKHIKDSLYNESEYITQLKKVVDPNNFEGRDELYMLEEFIVESLTNNVLNEALNNIESTIKVSAETKRPSLWQKIIELIKELFDFNHINDNTLLAQEFKAFGSNFKDIKDVPKDVQQNTVDIEVEEKTPKVVPTTDISDKTIAEISQETSSDEAFNIDTDEFFSNIDINTNGILLPNMNSLRSNLTSAEQAKFDHLLATGQTKIYCV